MKKLLNSSFGFAPLVAVIVLAVFALALIAGVYLVGQKVGFKPRASEQSKETLQERVLQGKAVERKVGLLIFNPILESEGGQSLIQYKKWNDPDKLTEQLIKDFSEVSGGYVNYVVTDRVEVNGYEVKADGFVYTDDTLLEALRDMKRNMHQPNDVDYQKLIDTYDICTKFNEGKYDEVWLWSHPVSGYDEAAMAGPEAFNLNGEVLTSTSCRSKLPIMGFNYERGLGAALESYGHRVENTMEKVFGGWTHDYGDKVTGGNKTAWDLFTTRDIDIPGGAYCGNMHYAPQTTKEYKWDEKRTVKSACDDFLTYPKLPPTPTYKNVSCKTWGCDPTNFDQWLDLGYYFKKWWYSHLPRAPLYTKGIANNWWSYIIDYDRAVNTKVEAAECRLEFFKDDSKNKPGKYFLEKKISTAKAGEKVVLYVGATNVGNLKIDGIWVVNSLNQTVKFVDGDKNCKKENGLEYKCTFDTYKSYPFIPGQTYGGAYRIQLPTNLASGTEISSQAIVYFNEVMDTACGNKSLTVVK